MNALLILVPVALIAAFSGGGKKAAAKKEPPPPPPPVPDIPTVKSDYPIMNAQCDWWVTPPIADEIDIVAYDQFVTGRFLEMRRAGETDMRVIAASILNEHNPQCQWPPGPDAPAEQIAFWNATLEGVEFYNRECYMKSPEERDPRCTWGQQPTGDPEGDGWLQEAWDYWTEGGQG